MTRLSSILQSGYRIGLIAIIAAAGCSDAHKIVEGDEFPFRPSEAQFIIDTVYTSAEVNFETDPGRGGIASKRMLLGNYENYTSNLLLYFQPVLEGARDSLYIGEPYIRFVSPAYWGDPVSGQTVTMHWIDPASAWEEEDNASIRSVQWDPEPFLEFEVGIDTFSVDSVSFPKEHLQWILDGHGENYQGFLLNGENLTFMREYFTRENFLDPTMQTLQTFVVYEVITIAGDTITRAKAIDADVHLVQHTVAPPEDRLLLDAQVIYWSGLKFDFSDIPKTATINRAILTMDLDDEASNRWETGLATDEVTDILYGFPITSDDFYNLSAEDFHPGEISTGTIINNQMTMNLTSLVQIWTAERAPNQGLLLRAATEDQDLTRLSFYAGNELDKTRAPRLIVEYYISSTETF